jgi:hypothetical protein
MRTAAQLLRLRAHQKSFAMSVGFSPVGHRAAADHDLDGTVRLLSICARSMSQ